VQQNNFHEICMRQCPKWANVFSGKRFCRFWGVLQNISAGVIYATVPKTGKRVLWEKVLPVLGGAIKCMCHDVNPFVTEKIKN
jgi:hypothetical protein